MITLRGIGVGFALLVMLLWMAGCGPATPRAETPQPVRTVMVSTVGALPSGASPSYIAVVRADRETELSFKVGGVVDRIGPELAREWQEGDAFGQGDLLGQLREDVFRSAVDSARADFELARSVLERGRRLAQDQAISQQEIDTMQARYNAASAALNNAQANLADSKLRAPFAGRILSRPVRAGETVGEGRPVLRIGSLESVQVELGVPDTVVRDFESIRKNREILLTLPALKDTTVTGRVDEVGVAAREGDRLFRVVIRVSNPGELIRPGMTATVRLPAKVGMVPGGVLVPLSALVADRAGAERPQLFVYVVDTNGRARRRRISTGEIVTTAGRQRSLSAHFVQSSVEVIGLTNLHERVVVLGAATLRDGDLVQEVGSPEAGAEERP